MKEEDARDRKNKRLQNLQRYSKKAQQRVSKKQERIRETEGVRERGREGEKYEG